MPDLDNRRTTEARSYGFLSGARHARVELDEQLVNVMKVPQRLKRYDFLASGDTLSAEEARFLPQAKRK